MPDVVRVSSSDRWAYLPVGSEAHQRLLHFAESGLADSNPVEVRLHSDAGDMFWELLEDEREESPPSIMPALALIDDGISMLPDEKLVFGRVDNGAYNEYADMSWLKNPSLKSGIPLSNRRIAEGDIVLTAWPSSGKLIPARIEKNRRDLVARLVDPQPSGERCFVTDDTGGLATVSLKTPGGPSVKLMPPTAMNSWLFSLGTSAVRQKPRRFSVSDGNGQFLIRDSKRGRTFAGRYRTSNPESELEALEVMLGHSGLGGIIPYYELTCKEE